MTDNNGHLPSRQAARQTAINLAKAGFVVFPVGADKRPLVKWGTEATSDPAAVERLWRFHPGPLIGLPCGRRNGFSVLDIDPNGMRWLKANAKRLPATLTIQTRRGGRHLYFRAHSSVRNSASRIAPGVDVRGEGGFVIDWYGAGYAAVDGSELQAWPAWLLAEISALADDIPIRIESQYRGSDNRAALAGLVRAVATAAQGERNSMLFWAANRAAEMSERDFAAGVLIEAACRAGLPSAEARRTVQSAFRRSQQ